MRQPFRSTVAALSLSAVLLLGTSGCTGGDDDSTADATADAASGTPAASSWPTAIDPATAADPFWVVWTDVTETGDGDTAALQPSIDSLSALGYQTLPWDPACQSGAEEQLAGLTGYANPLGVGVAFASEEDAGTFYTLYDGGVSLTEGTYTCGA
jgi:hypothetical protein